MVFHMSTVVESVYPKEPLSMSSEKDQKDETLKPESKKLVSGPCKADYIDVNG